MKKKDISALQSILDAAQKNATGELSSSVTSHRARLMDRYYGERYGNEVKGRSDYVDTTVRDTVEGVKTEIMDIFFGGDKVCSFSPMGDEDVDAAEQETEVCNYVVNQMNDGYKVFLDWFHDALAFKNGYVKRYWEEAKKAEVEEFGDLTPDELVAVVMGASERGEVEVLEQTIDEETGYASLKIKVTPHAAHEYRIESVPPEEIVVHPQWTRLDFEGCPFVAHKRSMTVSDLLEMGFDRKQVEALPSYANELDSEEKSQRHQTERSSETDMGDDTIEPSMREVLVYENYVRHDMDGDGIAEMLQVYSGDNGEVLKREGKYAVEQVDCAPFNVLTPYPIPHKHYGLALAELVETDQKIHTELTRQLLDNLVGSNNPDQVVDSDQLDADAVEDLEQVGLARTIRIPGGQASVGYMFPPQLAMQSIQAIEHMRQQTEQRTGVTRLNQGLDANSINKTFSGMKALMNTAQKKVLLIARNFAETGVKRLFMDMHRDLRKGPLKRIAARLRGNFVEVDPRTWADRADMSVSVGLGTGDRDVQFQRLAMILEQQKEGLAVGMVQPENIHHTLTQMVELSGFKDVEAFFPEPGQMPPRQEQPDPNAQFLQIEMAKAQADAQERQAKLALDQQKHADDVAIRREEIASKERIALAKLDREVADLAAEEAVRDMERELSVVPAE